MCADAALQLGLNCLNWQQHVMQHALARSLMSPAYSWSALISPVATSVKLAMPPSMIRNLCTSSPGTAGSWHCRKLARWTELRSTLHSLRALSPYVTSQGVSRNGRGASACHHRPNPALVVEDGKLQRGLGATIQLCWKSGWEGGPKSLRVRWVNT